MQRSVAEFFEDGAPQAAAGVSYYGMFSLFPLAILVVAVFEVFLGGEEAREQVIEFVLDRVPLTEEQGADDLREALRAVTGNLATFGVVGVAGLAFAASGLMGALRSALNRAWDSSDSRPALVGKLVDLLLVLGTGLVVTLSLGLTFLTRLAASVGDELGEGLGEVGSAFPRLILALGQLTPVVLSFGVFAFLYRVLPACEVRLRDVWPGALIAALGFELAKIGFSVYLDNFADYGAIYGSLGAVVAFLVFLFIAANVFLLGAEAASEWAAVRSGEVDRREASEPDQPLRKRLGELARGLVRRD